MDSIFSLVVSPIISAVMSFILSAGTFDRVKKFFEKKVTPDINIEDKAKEIQGNQDLARNLVILAGIEATYNIARGIVVALNFGVLAYSAYRFAKFVRGVDV